MSNILLMCHICFVLRRITNRSIFGSLTNRSIFTAAPYLVGRVVCVVDNSELSLLMFHVWSSVV